MEEYSKKYRHESNPLEKKFHDKFIEQNENELDYSRIAFPTLDGSIPISYVDEREMQIMINTIQWLGSPVGESFLKNLNNQ